MPNNGSGQQLLELMISEELTRFIAIVLISLTDWKQEKSRPFLISQFPGQGLSRTGIIIVSHLAWRYFHFWHINPLNFVDYKAPVLDDVYFIFSQAPNLHHVYPRDFLQNINDLADDAPIDSLMNICYLRAKTNIRISNKNPLEYFREFENTAYFSEVLKSQLIPAEFIKRDKFVPQDYKDFLYARAELICKKLQDELPDVKVNIV